MNKLSRRVFLPALLYLCVSSARAAGNEARCGELGVNCVCSEPLNTSTYATIFGYDFNPADTTTKECTKATPSAPGSVLEDGSGFRYVVETSGPMFAAMPRHRPGLKILRTKTTAEGNAAGGGQYAGHRFASGTTPVRRAWRGYLYRSSDFELYTAPNCTNSTKILLIGHDPSVSAILSQASGNYQMYGWTGWSSGALKCCNRGPGGEGTWGTYTEANVRGKWFRFEVVGTNMNTSGPTTTFKIYMKNITDNLPEVTIVDSTVPTTQAGEQDWTSTLATTWKPTADNWDQINFDLFRRDTCAGFYGMSHLMSAAWDTDAGQRIGAACEVEGGCGTGPDQISPAKPKGLKLL